MSFSLVGIDPAIVRMGLARVSGDLYTDTDTALLNSPVMDHVKGVVGDYLRSMALSNTLLDWFREPYTNDKAIVTSEGICLNRPIITVEGPAFARSPKGSVQVGFIHQAIYHAIQRFRYCTLIVVPPTTLKRYVTGSGRADKPRMLEGILKKWFRGYVPGFGEQDIYEAYALARLGGDIIGGNLKTSEERSIISAVDAFLVVGGRFRVLSL